jgi:hypothetical protein
MLPAIAVMTAQLRMIGKPGGSAAVDVADHPRWSSLVGIPSVG